MSKNSAMIDIETLDTLETAAVFQVGIIIFNEEHEVIDKKLYHVPQRELDRQLSEGRTMSLSTMLFHVDNPDSIKDSLNTERMFVYALSDIIGNIKDLLDNYEVGDIWQKGSMDLNVLSHANGGDFWHYHQPRELRTLMRECGVERGDPTHNALEDCHLQLAKLKECREVING